MDENKRGKAVGQAIECTNAPISAYWPVAKSARTWIYEHGDIADNSLLKTLARSLLKTLHDERLGQRPIFFLCHSIGGLVVKLALTEASHSSDYRSLLQNCYGVAFFATPHRGSKYLATNDYSVSIKRLLKLNRPLPPTLMNEIRLDQGSLGLGKIDENFKALASEMRVWTFYEALDSELSAQYSTGQKEILFRAPITAMRSALLGLRHEKVFGLQATHASCASWGGHTNETLRLFLGDLSEATQRAEELHCKAFYHKALKLEQRKDVIEIHGFYETEFGTPRLFKTTGTLHTFCKEGPEELLQKRLDISARTGINRARSLNPSKPSSTKTTSKHTTVSQANGKRAEEVSRSGDERRSPRRPVHDIHADLNPLTDTVHTQAWRKPVSPYKHFEVMPNEG